MYSFYFSLHIFALPKYSHSFMQHIQMYCIVRTKQSYMCAFICSHMDIIENIHSPKYNNNRQSARREYRRYVFKYPPLFQTGIESHHEESQILKQSPFIYALQFHPVPVLTSFPDILSSLLLNTFPFSSSVFMCSSTLFSILFPIFPASNVCILRINRVIYDVDVMSSTSLPSLPGSICHRLA